MEIKDWFTDWFNTSYYHILYKDRNDLDAQLFMKNITDFLKLPKSAHILDLPCGKGRHAVFLNSLGYKVTGADLAKNSIVHAKQFENSNLKFKTHDMRNPLDKTYNAIFNLFTSFGYFVDDSEDIKILENIKKGLKEGGFFVFDFLNAEKVKVNLVAKEIKIVDKITFNIERQIIDGFITKRISFVADGKHHSFTEQVKYLDVDKVKKYLEKVGFTICSIFGNYTLASFDKKNSDRLIIIAK
jgi:SAM-dependent methyltransferase